METNVCVRKRCGESIGNEMNKPVYILGNSGQSPWGRRSKPTHR